MPRALAASSRHPGGAGRTFPAKGWIWRAISTRSGGGAGAESEF